MGRIRTKSIEKLGREIKRRIRTEIGDYLSTNIGIAPNRFLAKVASNLHKPDGLDIITHENLLSVYKSIYLTDLPGINVRYQVRLNMQGILTPLDFYHASALVLKKQVFRSIVGYQWYMRLRGWEADKVEWKTKSFGQDYALGKKTDDPIELKKLLLKLCEKMGRRLRRHGYQAAGIHVGLFYADHTFWHHGHKMSHNLYTTRELYDAALGIFEQQAEKKVVSKLTVRCFDLIDNTVSQPTLFDMEDRGKKISEALDHVNDKYGEFTVTPASMMDMEKTILDRIAFGKAGIGEMSKIEGGFFHPPDKISPSSEV
jgi:DNA polymerase-4